MSKKTNKSIYVTAKGLRTWHDKNIQSKAFIILKTIFELQFIPVSGDTGITGTKCDILFDNFDW